MNIHTHIVQTQTQGKVIYISMKQNKRNIEQNKLERKGERKELGAFEYIFNDHPVI